MESRFSFNAFIIPIITIALLSISICIIKNNWPIEIEKLRAIDIFMTPLFAFTLAFLVLGEARQKIIKISIDSNSISKINLFGLKKYNFRDFDGFQTSFISSKNGTYEYLYLVRNNKKVIKISEQYHKNYFEIKSIITEKSKFLGEIKFSYWDELKEIFS
jgi:hypothetical protein